MGIDRRAIARALTTVERAGHDARALIAAIIPKTGSAHLIGVTGSAGAGKSSLIALLSARWRKQGRTVGIVAVDPSSASTGGALLGDRIRMDALLQDPGVFVRSVATRGAPGGIARATIDMARVLDAAGFDLVVIETVGAGQDQTDVTGAVETVLVVDAPNMGDDIQALKAGLGEVADIYVVTKSDLPGADRTAAAIRAYLALDPRKNGWRPCVIQTSTRADEGVESLGTAIDDHRAWLAANPSHRQARAVAAATAELTRLLQDELLRRALASAGPDALSTAARALAARQLGPYEALENLLSSGA